MSLKKQYLKSKPLCKVTFRLAANEAGDATTVKLIGDFNEWDTSVAPMKRLKNGDFTQVIELTTDASYAFRYLIDNERWENDWQADGYVSSGVGVEENSLVTV